MKKIMFNDEYGLTKAVLECRKTQTRRVINLTDEDEKYLDEAFEHDVYYPKRMIIRKFSRYNEGEVVAVAQCYKDIVIGNDYPPYTPNNAGWYNKMFVKANFMPHRIKITNIRVERLQDISDEDCLKEGLEYAVNGYYVNYKTAGSRIWLGLSRRKAFAALIDKVSCKGTWDKNPYVFVYDFELIK